MPHQIFSGRLDIDSHGDSWLLEQTGGETVILDVADFNLLNHQELIEGRIVSIRGQFGIPNSTTRPKLIAERLVAEERVRARAFELSLQNGGGSPVDHWLRAERQLLDL